HLISLQKGVGAEQLADVRFPVRTLGADFDEAHGAFMDTAAVMKTLDLVVTSDTAVAQLAGALGVPVWVALPKVPDWRWLLEREDSPWYPTMRLFRQDQAGDWAAVFTRIPYALQERVGTGAVARPPRAVAASGAALSAPPASGQSMSRASDLETGANRTRRHDLLSPEQPRGTIPEMLAGGFRLHQSGDLHGAEQTYREVLRVEPQQLDALFLLGMVARQQGRNDLACDYFGQVVRCKPDYVEAFNNLGNALAA